MSTNKSVSLLKAIKPYKQGWHIQVKLVHSCRQKTNYGGDTLKLIFADETGDKIHCTCKKTYIQYVIGQVTSLRDIQTVQVSDKDKKKVEFRLMDSSGESIACCLWGKYVEQLDDHLQQTKYPNMVCLIRFAKIGYYKGEVQVTNAFDASLILFRTAVID
ncbi:hypothetical protein F2Q69_00014837 [Brassica cretica]|uniref:Replication protein A 70 kDa DNA-binding subunit B/D first OB fold domain-containing protein n=1 Tax=Brassica cretica TaxID=69181 RepID=A0A8S9R3K1_BRACR|nr:hypothetical protein F2Q69_00014837 [Brassica cretica]